MSILYNISGLNSNMKYKLVEKLSVKPLETKFNKNPKSIVTFKFEDEVNKEEKTNNILVPFAYGYQNNLGSNNTEYPRIDYNFVGKLKNSQEENKKEIFDILNETKSIILSFHVGFGKTIYAIYLSYKLKYKTIVIVNRINLIDQWKKSIRKFCPKAKIQIIKSKTIIEKDIDFYLINIGTVKKRLPQELKHIGLVICDEAHLICSDVYSKALLYFQPKYMIALTATPQRDDGLHYILELYFGPYVIVRELWVPCNIYYVNTGFKPEVEKGEKGINWHSVLKSQSECEYRNNIIIKIARYFKSRNFLILCKYKAQCQYLFDEIKESGESVDLFIGTSEEFNNDARILVSTFSKVGVGFDHPKLDALIVASDVEAQMIQYYGRIFRKDDIIPMVFDFVDNFGVLQKHWNTRKKIYEKSGGNVKDFTRCFPEFYKYWENTMDITFT